VPVRCLLCQPRVEPPFVADAELERTMNDIAERFSTLCELHHYEADVGRATVAEVGTCDALFCDLTPDQQYAQTLLSARGRVNAQNGSGRLVVEPRLLPLPPGGWMRRKPEV
jgi:hypothetical protein